MYAEYKQLWPVRPPDLRYYIIEGIQVTDQISEGNQMSLIPLWDQSPIWRIFRQQKFDFLYHLQTKAVELNSLIEHCILILIMKKGCSNFPNFQINQYLIFSVFISHDKKRCPVGPLRQGMKNAFLPHISARHVGYTLFFNKNWPDQWPCKQSQDH